MTNTRKLKILFAAPYVPSEIRVRPYNFIKGLAQMGHSLTFIGLAGTYANEETIERLAKWCENVEEEASDYPFWTAVHLVPLLLQAAS